MLNSKRRFGWYRINTISTIKSTNITIKSQNPMYITLPRYFSSGVTGPTPLSLSLLCRSVVRGCNPKLGSLLGTMIFNLQSMWFPLFEHMALQLPRTCQFLGNSCQISADSTWEEHQSLLLSASSTANVQQYSFRLAAIGLIYFPLFYFIF